MMNPIGPEDHAAAAELAESAGRILLRIRSEQPPGSDVRAAGDAASHHYLIGELAERFPSDWVLSEEGPGLQERRQTQGGRTWIIDPLDGTREFGESGRTDWAVHVALVVDGHPAVGAVALPARELTLSTGTPLPAPAPLAQDQRPRLVVSRTRPLPHAVELARLMDADLVPLGSAGMKAMAVVLGEADVYVHAGGQYEWDSAAPVAVALAAGFHASRLDGSPLVYDQPDPWLPDLLITRPEMAERVIHLCSEFD